MKPKDRRYVVLSRISDDGNYPKQHWHVLDYDGVVNRFSAILAGKQVAGFLTRRWAIDWALLLNFADDVNTCAAWQEEQRRSNWSRRVQRRVQT